jgi:dihydroorotate dehydrogenase (NAD+) catalytic subunit
MKADFLGRNYKSPLWLASGTFGWGVEAWRGGFFPKGASALVTKGVSPLPMEGAPHPRIAEVNGAGQLLNAIGLQNSGVEGFVKNYLPFYQSKKFPIWVNVFAGNVEGFKSVVRKIIESDPKAHATWLAGFELNVSCPNVDKGGSEFANDLEVISQLIRRLKKEITSIPLMVKMSPMSSAPVEFAKVCKESGADALSISNTLLGAQFEPEKNQWSLGRRFGGLSGPALKSLSLH